jgi:long-chain acyl-CoA synthetase
MSVQDDRISFSRQSTDQDAIVWNGQRITYGKLTERIAFWRERLKDIKPGTVVAIEGDFSPESIAILVTLINANAIIVPLDLKQRAKNTKKYDIAKVALLITCDENDDVTIGEVNQMNAEGPQNEFYTEIIKRGIPGLILFTSGSSGEPKAAVHDLSKLLEKFKTERKALITINFLLFDHWGGLNTLFHILFNGGTVVTLQDRNPDYVCKLVQEYKVELLPTSPSFLNLLLLGRAYDRWDLSSLKIISYGSEPMPENLLSRVNSVFPNVSLIQTYGLIELGVLRSKSESNESLWVKIGGEGYKVRVVDGLLQIKSDSAMLGYLNADSPFTEDGWFMTGDAVEVKGEYYRILGRKSELINVGGEKVFPQEVENVILQLDFVEDVIVFGSKNPILGTVVAAKVKVKDTSTQEEKEMITSIKKHCNNHLSRFKVPVQISISHEEIVNERFKKGRFKA